MPAQRRRTHLCTALTLLAAALLLAACGGDSSAPASTSPATPVAMETGAMARKPAAAADLSGATEPAAAQAADAAAGAAVAAGAAAGAAAGTAVTPASVAPEPRVAAPGDRVKATGKLRLLAGPDPKAAAMNEYPAVSGFVVIEPGGNFTAYPVEQNGVRWYRVRAEDGLVGWLMADGVEPAP